MRLIFQFIFTVVFVANDLHAQDTHFTQLNSAFLAVNPALTGVFDNHNNDSIGGYLRNRVVLCLTNRNQYYRSESPLSSWQGQANIRIGSNLKNIDEGNLENNFNIGLSILQDKSFFGLLRKNSFTISASYQKTISKEKTSLGVGFSTSFIQRRIDISNLSFQNQFTSFGFDVNNIPSGEALISNAKSYQSFATGILLSCRSIGSKRFFKLGISAFNINKPKETIQDDESSFVPLRKVLHYSYQNYRPSGKIETFGIFQNQTGVNEFTLGLISDYFFNKNNRPQTAILQNSFGLGLIYRHKDALSPIIRTEIKNATFMLSYDITTSKLNNSMRGSQSFEATLQYRIKKN